MRLDSAAVSTTMFMMVPAPPRPMLEKNVTNGEVPDWYAVYGINSASSTSEPT